jgi:hypothetical protein
MDPDNVFPIPSNIIDINNVERLNSTIRGLVAISNLYKLFRTREKPRVTIFPHKLFKKLIFKFDIHGNITIYDTFVGTEK